MKKINLLVAVLMIMSNAVQAINEFRTPLSFRNEGWHHHWLGPIQANVWYNEGNVGCLRECDEDPCKDSSRWQAHLFNGSFWRCADKAYFDTDKNSNTRDTVGLSTLFFGKDSFRGEEVFAGGIIKDAEQIEKNALLGAARITPDFKYTERGVFLGGRFDYSFGCEKKWHAGGRTSVPFKVIEVEQKCCANFEETVDDLFKFRRINNTVNAGPVQSEYAIRLDFLNSLVYRTVENNQNICNQMIEVDGDELKVFNLAISGDDVNNALRAYIVKTENGECPNKPFRKLPEQVNGVLPVDGAGANGQTFFLENGLDYQSNLLCNRDAMGMLYLVPRAQLVNNNGPGTLLSEQANALSNTLFNKLWNEAFELGLEPVSEFFRNRGIDLQASEKIVGLGDIEVETYLGYGHRDEWYVDGVVGLRLPTGKDKDRKDASPYYLSTGHNNHTEVKLGVEAGWMPLYWMGIKADASYHHAFKRSELRAQSFKGATVKNIGALVDTDVSWNYFIGHLDWTVFHPWHTEIGMTLGYEIYGKKKDKVSLPCTDTTATDLLGRANQELDMSNLETRTNVMSHKVRTEVFHRWSLFEIFAGASHVFAGRNVMKESEAHLGFGIYF